MFFSESLYTRFSLILLLVIVALAWLTNAEAASMNLNWADNSSNETGFKIERKTGTGGTYAQIATVVAGVATYADSTLANGTTYCYRVRAFNSTGDSPYSNEVCATTSSLSVASLTADKTSPQPAGTTINFTATTSGGVGPIQYKWWVLIGTTWSVVKNWSTSNSYSWTPTATGNFKIGVWARSNGNAVDAPENNAYRGMDFSVTPLSVTGITADKTSPQPGGTTVNFTATPSGGVGPIQYKWWIFKGTTWSVIKDWSTSNAYSWTSTATGNFKIGVWARSNGNTVDAPENNAYRGMDFSVTPLSVTGITADKTSPQPAGTTINFTAKTTSGIAPIQYKWWVLIGTTWSVVKNWSTSNSYSWTPTATGNFKIGVWARSSGNTVDAPENNAYLGIAFSVGTSPAASVTAADMNQTLAQAATTIYVEPNGKCSGKIPCYSGIQQAINSAVEGAAIRVAQGTYHDNLYIGSSKNIVLEGGWNNTFLSRASDPTVTVIDGDTTADGVGDGSVLRIEASSGLATAVTVKGFTIQNGVSEDGGGVFVTAQSSGSVIFNLDGNIIRHNKSSNSAGGIGVYAQDPGGNVQSTLTNNIMYGNRTVGSGGAMHAASSNSGNTAITFINNTVSENVAEAVGDGLYVYAEQQSKTNLKVKNSIIWGNGGSDGQDIAIRQNSGSATVNASYSDIGNALNDAEAPGTYKNLGNNINANPLFVNSASGDFHIGAGSPALDRGTSDGAPVLDFEGNARPQRRGYDIGADERP